MDYTSKETPSANLPTFDTHLYEQVRDFVGLPDLAEDWIEQLHQVWKKQKKLTWQILDFEKQQNCQLCNVQIHSNPIIRQMMDETNELWKWNLKWLHDGGKSTKDENNEEHARIKKEKQEYFRNKEA